MTYVNHRDAFDTHPEKKAKENLQCFENSH